MSKVSTLTSEMPVPLLPVEAEVRYRMEVVFRLTVTPFVARQNANVYLLMNVGNLLSADEPGLVLGETPYWQVPIFCAFPEVDRREQIGVLAVDVKSGAILLEHSYPSTPQEIERRAEAIYHSLEAPSARA